MLRCSSLSLSLSQKAYAATSRTRCTSIRDQYSHAPIVPLLKKSNFSPSINTSCILLWNLKISRCYSTSKGEESVGLGDPLRRKSERPNFEPPQISDQANEKDAKESTKKEPKESDKIFMATGLDIKLTDVDSGKQVAVTEEQVDEWESKLRFLQYQTKKLQDDFERQKRLQAMDNYERRRFWILVLLMLLLLELSIPLSYIYFADEMDPDAIPDKYLGLWLHEGKPHAMLKITEDGRVNYQRPKCIDPPVESRKVRGRMRELTGQVMRVNLLSKVVFEEIKVDGAPQLGADGQLHLQVEGLDLVKQTASRVPQAEVFFAPSSSSASV